MTTRLKRLLVALLLTIPVAAPPVAWAASGDLSGWHEFTFGQTLGEIQKTHKCAAVNTEEQLTICRIAEPVKLHNLNYGQALLFDNEKKLVAIIMTLLPFNNDTNGEFTEEAYGQLALEIAKKYGDAFQIPAVLGRDKVGGFVWKFASGAYLAIEIEGSPRHVLITYHAANGIVSDY